MLLCRSITYGFFAPSEPLLDLEHDPLGFVGPQRDAAITDEVNGGKMYLEIAMLAYIVVLFLTLRDIRIFKRTGYRSYKRGAVRGLTVSTLVLLGAMMVEVKPELGLLIVLLGLFINKKGTREQVFTSAGTLDRFLGKTDYVKKK